MFTKFKRLPEFTMTEKLTSIPVYICYPGATLTIVNAGIYDIETDTRVNLADGMEPIVLDETTDAVFHLEASVFVLKFHFYEPQ